MKIFLGSNFYINTHKEGNIFIFSFLGISILLILMFGVNFFSSIFIALSIFSISFFRSPDRVLPDVNLDNVIISAADGKITKIETTELPEELGASDGKKYIKISTFLSVFNVHINYFPVNGKILDTKYIPGKFFNASLDKSSKDNERNIILSENNHGEKIAFVQIAGLVARRIVSYPKKGDTFKIGNQFGIIRFGSRVDVYFPDNYTIKVKEGQTMISGETILAEKK